MSGSLGNTHHDIRTNQSINHTIWCRHFRARYGCPRPKAIFKPLFKLCITILSILSTHHFVWWKFSFTTAHFHSFQSVRKCCFLSNLSHNLCPHNHIPLLVINKGQMWREDCGSAYYPESYLFFKCLKIASFEVFNPTFLTPDFMLQRNTIQACLAAITMAPVCFRIYEKASIDSGSRFVCYFYGILRLQVITAGVLLLKSFLQAGSSSVSLPMHTRAPRTAMP